MTRNAYPLGSLCFHTAVTSLLGSGLVLWAGCGAAQPDTETLQIGFGVLDRVMDANHEELSLAAETRAEIRVIEARSLEGGGLALTSDQFDAAEIRTADSSNEAVVHIAEITGSTAVIEALKPGHAELRFETSRGNRTFRVSVGHPVEVQLSHALWDARAEDAPPPVFIRGGTARFRMIRLDTAGRQLGGWSRDVPIHADPPHNARFTIREGDVGHVDVHLDRAGEVTLRPVGGDPLTVQIVEPESVLSHRVESWDPATSAAIAPLEALPVGDRVLAALHLTQPDGRRALGLVDTAGLDSTTPDVCQVDNMERWFADGVFQISGLSSGECGLALTFNGEQFTLAFPVGGDPDNASDDVGDEVSDEVGDAAAVRDTSAR
jgi:hypothetical protein